MKLGNTWLTRDGRMIAIVDLEDDHLRNILVWLVKWDPIALRARAAMGSPDDENAPYLTQTEERDNSEKYLSMPLHEVYAEVYPNFPALIADARRRGFDIPDQLKETQTA